MHSILTEHILCSRVECNTATKRLVAERQRGAVKHELHKIGVFKGVFRSGIARYNDAYA